MTVKEFLFVLFAHHTRDNLSHTIKISIGKWELYLCARCTGIYSALIVSFLLWIFVFDITILPLWATVMLAYSLGTPAILSWGRQTLTGRDNTNSTRIGTGIGGGIGLSLLFYLPSPLRELSIFGIFSTIFLILYFGKIRPYGKERKRYVEFVQKMETISDLLL
ncbi:MAG: DUF2085 domain-containing protein [Candidatus Helarchaeota archaeon]